MSENKRLFTAFAVIVLGLFVCLGAVGKYGGIKGKVTLEQDGATLNGTATITGTAFYIKENLGNMSVFYDVTAGTSTAHYYIQIYTSPDNSTWTTTPVVITATSDETSVDVKHVDVPIYVAPYGRIDVVGATSNATDTAISVWRVEQ